MKPLFQGVHDHRVGVAVLEQEFRGARHHVGGAGFEGDFADIPYRFRTRFAFENIDQVASHTNRRAAGIQSHVHRRGPRMVGAARKGDPVAADSNDCRHDADF